MSRFWSRIALFAVAATAGVCAPGCGRRAPSASPPTVMRIGVGAPPKGIPNTGTDFVISMLRSDTWVSSRPDGRVGGRIVESWNWDRSGTELRLKLRPSVFFHDGTPLTAETAAEALRATDTRRDNLSLRSIESVKPAGADSIVLKLRERNAFLLNDLGAVPVLKAQHPDIGTGPYQVSHRTGNDATLINFPQYFHGRPPLAGVEVVNYPTQRNAWTALMRGDIDMLYEVSRDSVEFVQAESTVRTYSFPRPYYILLAFNMRHPTLRNVEVRRAINEALDRSALVRDGLRGQATSADGPISPQHWAYSPPGDPFIYNPDSARRRLDAAGLPLKASRDRQVPVRFSFRCLLWGNDSRFDRLAMIAQKELAEVGIDMQLQPLELQDLGKRMALGDFDAYLFELSGPRLSRVYDFWRSSNIATFNNTGYRAADAVLDRLRAAQSDDETRAAVGELLHVMHDDPPAAFIAWQKGARAVSTRFDVGAELDRDILTNLWQWRPASSQMQAAR